MRMPLGPLNSALAASPPSPFSPHAPLPAIVVMVVQLTPQVKAQIPQQLEGFPVVVDQSGEITPF